MWHLRLKTHACCSLALKESAIGVRDCGASSPMNGSTSTTAERPSV